MTIGTGLDISPRRTGLGIRFAEARPGSRLATYRAKVRGEGASVVAAPPAPIAPTTRAVAAPRGKPDAKARMREVFASDMVKGHERIAADLLADDALANVSAAGILKLVGYRLDDMRAAEAAARQRAAALAAREAQQLEINAMWEEAIATNNRIRGRNA